MSTAAEFVGPSALADLLGVKRVTVYRRTLSGEIPAAAVRRVGNRARYSLRLLRSMGVLAYPAQPIPDLPTPALTLSYTTTALLPPGSRNSNP